MGMLGEVLESNFWSEAWSRYCTVGCSWYDSIRRFIRKLQRGMGESMVDLLMLMTNG